MSSRCREVVKREEGREMVVGVERYEEGEMMRRREEGWREREMKGERKFG